jgi:D-alanyl-D-alanine carboxypeptidase
LLWCAGGARLAGVDGVHRGRGAAAPQAPAMKRFILCVLAAGCHSHDAAPTPAAGSSAAPAPLDAIVDKAAHDAHLLGLEAMVVDHGKVVLDRGVGFTDLDRKTAITADTIFAIGSLSKQFTAAAILRLVDEGQLALTDHAAKFLPELPADITIQELLWQTAGLAEYAWGINVGKSPAELVHVIATTPQTFPTGTQWKYSNSNYFVLGRIVEVVSKQSLGDYLRDHVLAPAGLAATRMCEADTATAHPTIVMGDAPAKGPPLEIGFYGGAGGICSTAHDLLRWQDALFGGKVLSAASLATMTTPGKLADGSPINYAAGLISDHVLGHARIWHNGGIPSGYESELAYYPDDRVQIVLLTNTLNTPPAVTLGNLERALAVAHLHLTMPKAPDLALTPADLAHYTGTYATQGITAEVTINGTHLHVRVAGGVDANLLAQGNDRFVLDGHTDVQYAFTRGADGTATRIDVVKDGSKLATLERVR